MWLRLAVIQAAIFRHQDAITQHFFRYHIIIQRDFILHVPSIPFLLLHFFLFLNSAICFQVRCRFIRLANAGNYVIFLYKQIIINIDNDFLLTSIRELDIVVNF